MNIQEATQLAHDRIDEHIDNCHEWSFKINTRCRDRVGQCLYQEKTLELSKWYILHNDKKEVLDTILHEIAHAMTPGQDHNKKWKETAISIGCSGQRCYGTEVQGVPDPKWYAKCVACGREFKWQRLSRNKQKSKFIYCLCQKKRRPENRKYLEIEQWR